MKPPHSFHVVKLKKDSLIDSIQYVRDTDTLINGGFFVFKKEDLRLHETRAKSWSSSRFSG